MFIFDGVTKTITIDNSAVVNNTITFTPEELWTAYVDWSVQSDNLKYYATPAFNVIGGNDIGGGEAVGNYLFIRNDLGWVGVPPSIDDVNIVINGSLYGTDVTLPIVQHITGQATNLIINRSVVSTLRTVNSGSALTTAEHDKLFGVPTATDNADAVWASNTRTVTSAGLGGVTAQEVWSYGTRELTVAAGLSPAQEAKLNEISTDVKNMPSSVWNYII